MAPQPTRRSPYLARIILIIAAGLTIAGFAPVFPARAAERVVLQLKWFHQFQFAGYYAAKEMGYYDQAGLDVEIREGGPGVDVVTSGL